MSDSLLVIHHFFDRLRRRAWLLSVLELALLTLTLCLTLMLCAATLGMVGWVHRWLTPIFGGLALLIPLLWAGIRLWPRLSRLDGPARAARFVDASEPSMHNLALSAVELSRSGASDSGMSSSLIEATVQEASRRVGTLEMPQLWPTTPLKPWWLAAGASSVLFLLTWLLAPLPLQEGLTRFLSPPLPIALPGDQPPSPDASEGPALGDIRLELIFPEYLQRPNEVIENSSGDIQAPRGSQVEISARSTLSPIAAALIVGSAPPVAATLGPRGAFSARFVVEAAGTYHFALTPGSGMDPVSTRSYPLTLEEDAVPIVEIFGLEPVTELSPNQPVSFRYHARDDHGLTRVELVVEGPTGAVRKELSRPGPGVDSDERQLAWYPAEWNVPEGGGVDLWIEALDNDTISGPKIGRSTRYRMSFSSAEKRRQEALQAKEQLKEALISTLGDALVSHDAPSHSRTTLSYAEELELLSRDMHEVERLFSSLIGAMSEDTQEERVIYNATLALQKGLLQSWYSLEERLKARIAPDAEDGLSAGRAIAEQREGFVERLEDAVLKLESFANQQRMESITERGEDLKQAGEDLLKMLADAQARGETPDMQALAQKLQLMKQQMAKLAEEMRQLDRTSAEWYQNPAGELQEASDSLASLEELIQQGKLEDAARLLEEYLDDTQKLMEALKEMQNEEFGNEREQLSKDMGEVIRGLKDLERQQERLANETGSTREQVTRSSGVDSKSLEKLTRDALDKLEAVRKSAQETEQAIRSQNAGNLPPIEDDALRELREQLQSLEADLKTQDVSRALRDAWEAVRDFRRIENSLDRARVNAGRETRQAEQHARSGRQSAEDLARDLEDLAERMDRSQRQAASQGQGLAVQQQSLQQKGQELSDKLKDYAQDSAIIPGNWGERLEQAGQAMQGASRKLGGGELAGGEADQRSALQALQELRQEMESTQRDMQNQARGAPQQRPGGQQQGQAGQQANQGRGEDWGNRNLSQGRVDISKEYKTPEEYRQELMEGMKGDSPSRYKRLNRDYYEKLVR